MTYRDDHDAALARADALEKELADARAEHQRDEAKIAALEARLRDAGKPPAAPKPKPKRLTRRWWITPAVIGISLVVGLVVIVVMVRRLRTDKERVAYGWDVQEYLAEAIADAKQQWPDAELMKITADYVDSYGRAQLDVSDGRLSYWFRSPARATPPPAPARIGMPAPSRTQPCQLRERIYKRDTSLTRDTQTDSSPGCGESQPQPLGCTIPQIWQRAIAKGAPASALASITLRTEYGKRVWKLEIDDATHAHDFHATFDDDCR
jgi:type II secretory pathway pseudopilin PulG